MLLDQFRGESFTVESALSGRTYVNLLREALSVGYELEIHYLVLPNAEFAIRRVKARVAMGGHDVEEQEIRRRKIRHRASHCAFP